MKKATNLNYSRYLKFHDPALSQTVVVFFEWIAAQYPAKQA
jgi:hypothetical protein